MAKPNKARISYNIGTGSGGVTSVINFHTVESEDHEVTGEITKYPSQSGFLVSNHAIKRNRKVKLVGYISNNQVKGTKENHNYGTNAIKTVFSSMQKLVQDATPCDVLTNFTSYSPVIFTKFSTKLEPGMTETAKFTISGEEVQIAKWDNGVAPMSVKFKPVVGEDRKALVDELNTSGIEVADTDSLEEGEVDLSKGFSITDSLKNGEAIVTTYALSAFDSVKKAYSHIVSTSDVVSPKSTTEGAFDWSSLMGGKEGSTLPELISSNPLACCIKDGIVSQLSNGEDGLIDTALGRLNSSIHGAAYKILGVNGDRSAGQTLLSMGASCLILGKSEGSPTEIVEGGLDAVGMPDSDDVLGGASRIGTSIKEGVFGKPTATKIIKVTPETVNPFRGELL